MGEEDPPSSPRSRPPAIAAAHVELGPLRNGVGSLKNLELLMKSIKVGQKGLFAAIAAVHADCAAMIASASALGDALVACGVDGPCARRLERILSANVQQLESELSRTVASKRLSVSERLKLEGVLARTVRELGAALHLALLLERIRQPRPAELTPVGLIHSGADAAGPDGVAVYMDLPEVARDTGVSIHLDVAQLLLAIGVGLCAHGQVREPVLVSVEAPGGERPVTRITRGRNSGPVLRLTPPSVVEPTLPCAEAGLRSLGGSFEYSAPDHRVCIWWPLS